MLIRVLIRSLLAVTLWAVAAGAQAQVTGISGSVADHQVVTISGSGFGTKPNGAKPYAFFEFGRGQASASSYSRTAWGAPASGVFNSTMAAPNSKGSWEYRIGVDNGDVYSGGGGAGTRFTPGPAGRDLYVYYRLYMNWDGVDQANARSDWNLKGFRMWSKDTTVPDLVLGYADSQTDGNPRVLAEDTMNTTLWLSGVQGIIKNSWKVEEITMRQSSSVGSADAFWQLTSNGINSPTYSNLVTRTSSYPGPYTDLFWHQSERTGFGSSSGKFIAYDLVYIDDSWARVVVTNSSTWNTSSGVKVEIQVPVTWSNNQIQFLVRQGALDSLSGKYLYVINSSGTPVSTKGFPLTGGSAPSSGPVQPNPPTDVTVQ